MKKTLLLFFLVALVLSSCWDFTNNAHPEPPPKKVWGYKPVYSVDSTVLTISAESPRPVKLPAKIYVKGNLIFQNDLGTGIHVIDNSNPSAPAPIGFIKILGNSEISIKGNMLYANSFEDLVVVDVTDWQNVKEKKRIKNAFQQGAAAGSYSARYSFVPPPEHGVYFECTQPYEVAQILTGWVRDSIYDYNCFYP